MSAAGDDGRHSRFEVQDGLPSWQELFPEGRHVWYEGEDPEGFRREVRDEFGFDPGEHPGWGKRDSRDPDGPRSYRFYCPAAQLDAVYGAGRWPIGS